MPANPALIVRVAATIEELKKNLAEGKSQIETTTAAMQKMAASFSGDKLIQQANNVAAAVQSIGGVAKLTAAEQERVNSVLERALEKYRVLGREAPAGMQQLADATKRVEVETKKLDVATQQTTRSGESWTSWLGKANGLLASFGIGLSVGAVVGFGRELLAAADELTKLHDKTGLSIEGLQQFQIAGDDAGNTIEEIAAAITKLEDKLVSGDKSAAGALDKLGLSFEALKGLSPEQQFIAISDAIRGINDPAVQVNIAIDLFGKAGALVLPTLKRGFDDLKDSAVGMSRETVRVLDELGDAMGRFWRSAKGVGGETLATVLKAAFDPGGIAEWKHSVEDAAAAAEKAAPKFKALAPPGLPEDLDAIEKSLTKNALALANAAEQLDKNEKAMKPFRDAMREIDSAGQTWKTTLDGINGSVVEAIKFYLQAGVAQGTLATAYDLTATQVKAIDAALRDQTATQQKAAQAADDHAKAIRETAAALEREAEASQHAKQQAEEKAAAERKIAEEKKALNRAMGNTLDIGHAVAADPALAELLHMGWSLENAEQILLSRKFGFTPKLFSPKGMPETTPDPSERVPGYQHGGVGDFGSGTLALLHGREAIVPLDRPGAAAGASGLGVTNHITIYVTQPLGTPTAIAKAVDDALMRRQRAIGTRF